MSEYAESDREWREKIEQLTQEMFKKNRKGMVAVPINTLTMTDQASIIQLRDWFAGLAMQAIIQCPDGNGWGSGRSEDIVELAFEFADEMMEARNHAEAPE
jgi:hypothetical protein